MSTSAAFAAPSNTHRYGRARAAARRNFCVAAAEGRATVAVPPPAPPPSRRSALLLALQAASAALLAQPSTASEAATPSVVTVGRGKDYATITQALEHVPDGGTVEIYSGRYAERLVITRPVTIAAAAGDDVELAWSTQSPYEATIEVDASLGSGLEMPGAVALRGLRLRHSSPSIANNYAVHLVGCGAVLEDCDISSTTGGGVGIEGGAPRLLRCTVHDCARQGVAIFGGLFDRSCGAALEQCTLSRNTLSGLLVRDGASPAVGGCTLSGNGEWGLLLQDAGGSYLGCEIVANARGSVAYSLLDDGVDTAMMVVYNKLDRPVQSLGRV